MNTKTLSFVGNFTFDVHDQSDLYYFVGGPVAVNPDLSLMYMPITGATSFQRLFLLAYNYNTSTYYQSPWMYNNGDIAFLYYDPIRKRLFGLRDKSTFTFFIEEYDLQSLNVTKLYTKQDGEKYAFSFAACTCFDYNENWIIQVRTRFEGDTVNAYWIKMDLNLVGQKEDIVTDFHLMPNVNNFLTMTYDIQQTKLILGTWQHGSIELDVYMFHLDPKESGKFPYRNENLTLLFKTNGENVEMMDSVWNPVLREVLFIIQTRDDHTLETTNYMLRVEFDTLHILEKSKITDKQLPLFELWEYFYM
ncbi:unnamed protein product [Adineta steineri]|uniref:Uncharacterized protein n=2 Tax=Adineta steineri TaxID=433720 RepID=A0A819SSD4_9BILA|nr:unnamed protein product [Adineta steineri]CAF4064185.1 unnamed protein product [Adineta steineri]